MQSSAARERSLDIDPVPRLSSGLGFEGLQDEINRLFDLTRVPESRGIFERAFSPAVDVIENPDGFEVLCDGRTDGPQDYRGELPEERFQRTLQMPLAVDPNRVEAVLKDGVLRITLPKHEGLKPHQVTVKAK